MPKSPSLLSLPMLLACSGDPAALPTDQPGPVVPIDVEILESVVQAGTAVTIRATMPVQMAGLDTYVAVARGGEGAGSCPPALGGDCLGVLGPMDVVGPGATDGNGVVEFTYDVPADFAAPQISLQVGVLFRGTAYLSPPASWDVTVGLDTIDALGPTMWLDVDRGVERDGDRVTAWRDQSGHGNDVQQAATGAQPRWSWDGLAGHPALYFDGNDVLERSDGFPTGSYTKAVVFDVDRFQGPNNLFSSEVGGHVLFYQRTNTPRMLHGSDVFAQTGTATDRDGTTLLVATYDAATGRGTLSQDGVVLATVGPDTAPLHVSDAISIGGHNGGNGLLGHIGEVLAFDRVLTADEQAALTTYVQDKYTDPTVPDLSPSLWLTADEGVERDGQGAVTTWRDRSGLGLDLQVTPGADAPTHARTGMRSRATLTFDGTQSLARDDGFAPDSYTKVVVFDLDDLTQRNPVFGSGRTTGTGHALLFWNTDLARLRHDGNFAGSATPVEFGRTTTLVATYDADTQTGTLRQDGVVVGSGTNPPHSMRDIQIGGHVADRLHGAVSEVIAFDRVLTTAELDEIDAYLDRRYPPSPLETVAVTDLPRPLQVLGRDGDTCTTTIAGTVTDPATTVAVSVTPDGAAAEVYDATVTGTSFSVDVTLDAGRINHTLDVTATLQGASEVVASSEKVVCGDLYLVSGQSNAEAYRRPSTLSQANVLYGSDNDPTDDVGEWVRTFGSSIDDPSVADDTDWDYAEGEARRTHAAVGQWPLTMAHFLQLNEDIPIGIVNGGRGERSLQENLRAADPEDLTTMYGRLLWRARTAGIDGDVRAMFWFQGENDHTAGAAYTADFGTLYDAWREDYPSLERVYVLQTRDGCLPSRTSSVPPGEAPPWEYHRLLDVVPPLDGSDRAAGLRRFHHAPVPAQRRLPLPVADARATGPGAAGPRPPRPVRRPHPRRDRRPRQPCPVLRRAPGLADRRHHDRPRRRPDPRGRLRGEPRQQRPLRDHRRRDGQRRHAGHRLRRPGHRRHADLPRAVPVGARQHALPGALGRGPRADAVLGLPGPRHLRAGEHADAMTPREAPPHRGLTTTGAQRAPRLRQVHHGGPAMLLFVLAAAAANLTSPAPTHRWEGAAEDLVGFADTPNGPVLVGALLDDGGAWRFLSESPTQLHRFSVPRAAVVDPVGLADVDGDGWDELLFSRNGGGLSARSIVDGTERAELPFLSTRPTLIGGHDFDGDGVDEVYGNLCTPNGIRFCVVEAATAIPLWERDATPRGLALVQGDADPELELLVDGLVLDPMTGTAIRWLTSARGKAYAVADIDGDGPDDVVISDLDLEVVDARTQAVHWTLPGVARARRAPAIGDFDGDGLDDAVVRNEIFRGLDGASIPARLPDACRYSDAYATSTAAGGAIVICENAQGVSTATGTVGFLDGVDNPTALYAIDLDGDGADEVVVVGDNVAAFDASGQRLDTNLDLNERTASSLALPGGTARLVDVSSGLREVGLNAQGRFTRSGPLLPGVSLFLEEPRLIDASGGPGVELVFDGGYFWEVAHPRHRHQADAAVVDPAVQQRRRPRRRPGRGLLERRRGGPAGVGAPRTPRPGDGGERQRRDLARRVQRRVRGRLRLPAVHVARVHAAHPAGRRPRLARRRPALVRDPHGRARRRHPGRRRLGVQHEPDGGTGAHARRRVVPPRRHRGALADPDAVALRAGGTGPRPVPGDQVAGAGLIGGIQVSDEWCSEMSTLPPILWYANV